MSRILFEEIRQFHPLGKRFEVALKKEIEGRFLMGPRLRASTIEPTTSEWLGLTLGAPSAVLESAV